MSELKVYHCNEWHNEYTEFYLKAEADKVIAELKDQYKDMDIAHTVHIAKMNAKLEEQESVIADLKEKHKTEVKELLCLIRDKENNFNSAFDSEENEVRHQKYKRCLAMASKCRLRARWFGDNAFYKKERWALQWHKRWLKIAEKFKGAK